MLEALQEPETRAAKVTLGSRRPFSQKTLPAFPDPGPSLPLPF